MKQIWFNVMIIGCFIILSHHQALADDETSAFSNPAQAAHAANLADQLASQPNEATEEAASAVETAEDKVTEAEEALAADPTNEDLQDQLAAANQELSDAEDSLAEAIGDLAGVISSEISDMRAIGMGWGEIAHELGVHPGLLGLGHTKAKGNKKGKGLADPENEIAAATKRDVANGWGKGHGKSTSSRSSGKKGLGLSETGKTSNGKGSQGNSGKGNNSKGGSSKGNSKGGPSNDNGNNGKGNDKGNKGGNSEGKGKN